LRPFAEQESSSAASRMTNGLTKRLENHRAGLAYLLSLSYRSRSCEPASNNAQPYGRLEWLAYWLAAEFKGCEILCAYARAKGCKGARPRVYQQARIRSALSQNVRSRAVRRFSGTRQMEKSGDYGSAISRTRLAVKRHRLPRIPAKDRTRIEAALAGGKALSSVQVREAFRRLREIVKTFRALRARWGQSEPAGSRRNVRLKLERIAVRAGALIEALGETRSDEAALDYLWARIDVQGLLLGLGELRDEALAYTAAGRPLDENLGAYVEGLAHIWEDTHGDWPRRAYDPYLGEESGRFRRFVDRCVQLILPGRRVSDSLIRRVLKGRRILERRLMDKKSLNQQTVRNVVKCPPA